MSNAKKKDFKMVNKIYEASDYKSSDQTAKGLAETHEQVSDSYMTGDVFTHNPAYQNKERAAKGGQ
ncbi:YozQ family protein [Bacillus benzoevorans]|uniref:DUF4025 domain-containing protein n=1 Tax=Bacillus benzoevorans TaxID=1456 RepID=A0A7X0HQX7_9BACI|nr:hypothetical protein [Bacillus benzoevorans]